MGLLACGYFVDDLWFLLFFRGNDHYKDYGDEDYNRKEAKKERRKLERKISKLEEGRNEASARVGELEAQVTSMEEALSSAQAEG